MQFLIIGLDGIDDGAAKRRDLARGAHIKLGDELLASGNMWYGAALLNDNGEMNGSMLMVNFPSEDDLNQWLAEEPYMLGQVWKTLQVYKCKTRDPWQFNRPKEFFDNLK